MTEDRFIEIYDNLDEKFSEKDLKYAIDNFEIVAERAENDIESIYKKTYITVVKVKNRFFEIFWDMKCEVLFGNFSELNFYVDDVNEVFPHTVETVIYY